MTSNGLFTDCITLALQECTSSISMLVMTCLLVDHVALRHSLLLQSFKGVWNTCDVGSYTADKYVCSTEKKVASGVIVTKVLDDR